MSRIVLKERKFNPTNNDLGVFSSVDLETVEMRYKESDVVNDSEGNDGNKSKNHVPKPKDEDSIKPSFDNFKPPDSSGGSGGSGNKKKDEDKGKEKVDLENIQEPDIESEDFSNNQDNQGNGESGTGSSSEEGGDSENQPSSGSSGEQMNGGNSLPIDNNKSKESEGEDDSGQGQNGSNQNNQNGNSNGTGEGGEDTEDDYGGDEDSENGSSQSTNGNSQKSENEDNGSDLEGQGGDSGEQASQNSSDDSQQDDGSGNSQSGEEGNSTQKGNDGSQNSKSQNSKQEGESSNNSNSQNGQNGQGGQSKDSPDGGDSGDVQQGEDGNEEGSDRLEGWDDEEDDYGEDSESELEKALKKAENSLSDLEKKEREKIEKEDKTNDSKPQQPKQLSDVEKKAAKDLIEDAIRSAKDKGDDENVEEMNDLLSKLDAHTLTSMVNVRGKGDWKHQLDKIFDQATGAEISINPNLVNKRIEDAPPGREDDTNQITNIAVLMDQSGSMGSHQFKTAISHVDTMLSVRKLGNVNFHIVGFSDWSLKKTAGTYKKTKGRMLKKVLLSEYSASDSGTNLTEAFQVLATKVRKVDAIMIFTDAEIWDDRKFNDNQMVMSYVKRNKRKIIWVLTHDVNEAKQKGYIMKFTPYSAKNKLYVRFKKSSS